jgi:hypothetical protein
LGDGNDDNQDGDVVCDDDDGEGGDNVEVSIYMCASSSVLRNWFVAMPMLAPTATEEGQGWV